MRHSQGFTFRNGETSFVGVKDRWHSSPPMPMLDSMRTKGCSPSPLGRASRKSPNRAMPAASPKTEKPARRADDESPWAGGVSQLAAIVQHSNDAVFSRKLDGTITTWNAAAERIFGYRAKEAIGRGSRLLLPRGHQDEFRQLLRRIRRGEIIQHFETERLCKDGRQIFVSLTLSPVRDSDHQLIGFSTIARDITGQRKAREALQRSEEALTDLFEEASVGLMWTTSAGRILRANQALLEMLECTRKELVDQSIIKSVANRLRFEDLLKQLANRQTVRNVPVTLRTRNNQARAVLVDASAFWDQGKLGHLRWFVRDITRRMQLEREVLAISERERNAFSRELHDSLGQHLSGVLYLNNVLRDRLQEMGSSEFTQAARISLLLKEGLEQARAVARGLSPVRPEPDGLMSALRHLAKQNEKVFGIRCWLRCFKPLLVGNAETANHLYRIAQEAVHNAVRHGRAKQIGIELSRNRQCAKLKVFDNGKGIGTLSPRRKGLGLRIMQYRASLLGGTVLVRRRPEGGTEVSCEAPAAALAWQGMDKKN